MPKQPTPPVPPEGLSQEQQHEFLVQHGHAYNLQAKSAASYLYGSAHHSVNGTVPPQSFEIYLAKVLEDAGAPSDPIERMLVEQIVLAHHNLGRLYLRAATAETVDKATVFEAAAARLLGELRRTALALKEYRTPAALRQHTVIQQQNVAESQQVAYLQQPAGHLALAAESNIGNELNLNPNSQELLTCEQPDEEILVVPESQASRSRQAELLEARAMDAGGA